MDKQLLKWAQDMGYPGADAEEFRNNVHKLIRPTMKPVWAHILRHVRPADEVSKVKKQLLVYKHSVEGNSTEQPLEKLESVEDYNAFLNKKQLRADIDILTQKIALSKPYSSPEKSASKIAAGHSTARGKIEKYRTLVAFRKKLEREGEFFKNASSVLEMLQKPSYTSKRDQLRDDDWDLKVTKLCEMVNTDPQTDPRIEMLKSSFEITLPPLISASDKHAKFVRSMQEYNISCYQNIALLREKRDELLRKLETETTALIDELSNSDNVSDQAKACMVKKTVAQIRTEGEQMFLRGQIEEDKNSTLDRSLTMSYVEIACQADRVDQLIAEKYEECLPFYTSFPTEKLPELRQQLLAEMKMFSEKETSECVPYALRMKELSELVDEIYETPPHLLKKMSSETPFEVAQALAISQLRSIQMKHSAAQEAKQFDKLKLSHVKVVNTPTEIISSVQKAVDGRKLVNSEALVQIDRLATEGEECITNAKSYMNAWGSCLLTETAPLSSSYFELLELLKSDEIAVLKPEVRNNVIKKTLNVNF
ncbi:Hypothetical protein NTJ_08484 [Nesidiocoris tenuis]|uniref:HAUS augmin-like complex subunit 6 N-terminal domain-containing protein n=1 Tax=Nesidiocoris tenuis TaxID=355587 RepID=A0ABN7AU01_9HEMI|nr:Hypothetical protein NTJ_08484 [Nesidiocoris tenuis]